MNSSTPKIIGIVGHSGAGKSTLARYLEESFMARGKSALIQSFASPLKQDIVDLGYPHAVVYGKPTSPEMRTLFQAHGQAARAVYGQDYWVVKARAFVNQINNANPKTDVVIFDDVRQINEAEWIREQGYLIDLRRPSTDPSEVFDTDPQSVREVPEAREYAHYIIGNVTSDGLPGSADRRVSELCKHWFGIMPPEERPTFHGRLP